MVLTLSLLLSRFLGKESLTPYCVAGNESLKQQEHISTGRKFTETQNLICSPAGPWHLRSHFRSGKSSLSDNSHTSETSSIVVFPNYSLRKPAILLFPATHPYVNIYISPQRWWRGHRHPAAISITIYRIGDASKNKRGEVLKITMFEMFIDVSYTLWILTKFT